MKTIDEKAEEYADKIYPIAPYGLILPNRAEIYCAFKEGVLFSQEWLPIEKDNCGFTTDRQIREMASNLPFLLKGETEREELYHEIDNDVDKQYYTHWRPIELK